MSKWWLHFLPHVKHGECSVNICGFLQKSHGNGPLNRLLMAAKRKYMETELPPQESEGKTSGSSQFWPLLSLHEACFMSISPRRCQSESHLLLFLMPWWIRCILVCFHSCFLIIHSFFFFFLSFCSDLFQDLSQLQETWLTEGEMCLQAAFPLSLYFSLIISSLLTVMRLDDVSVWKDWRTQKPQQKKKYSKKTFCSCFIQLLRKHAAFHHPQTPLNALCLQVFCQLTKCY